MILPVLMGIVGTLSIGIGVVAEVVWRKSVQSRLDRLDKMFLILGQEALDRCKEEDEAPR